MPNKVIDNLGNFVNDKGQLFLVRCPKCKSENYAFDVAEGICAWCGYDANQNKEPVKNDNTINI